MARKPGAVQERELIAADLAWLMADPRGRRILWRLWQSTGVFGPAVTDPAHQAFAEGRRSVGLEYWQHVVSASPPAAASALTENAGSSADGRKRRDTPERDGTGDGTAERWRDVIGADGDDPLGVG